jgi:23S rRNA G2445 N2-methylase RlmL
MPSFFAITNRGLEAVCAAELKRIPGVQELDIAYRRVLFEFSGNPPDLLLLKTADDLFISVATWKDLPTQRSALALIAEYSRQLELNQAIEPLRQVRYIPGIPTFSVTANFVGKRNYSMEEIKSAVAEGVASEVRWPYVHRDEGDVNIRVFIEHATAFVGVRLAVAPLHRRAYKQEHISGSLKPTVASAMLEIAQVANDTPVLDPFCGAGTILIEAALRGAPACGGDLTLSAVQAARENTVEAFLPVMIPVYQWDALHLPLPSASVARVVTNLPWGRQVEPEQEIASFYTSACAEIERVLAPSGQMALLTNLPELVQFTRPFQREETEISLFGQTPHIIHVF